jgi:hypothetical protein
MSEINDSALAQGAPVTEKTLWDTIAASHSPEWAEAHRLLQKAHDYMTSVEPLGAIEAALNGEEIAKAEAAHSEALARFTIIDETKRRDPTLSNKFNQMLAQHRVVKMLDDSIETSEDAADASMRLSEAFKHLTNSIFRRGPKN